MTAMRAKMVVTSLVSTVKDSEQLTFKAVGADGAYPSGGLHEDNTYALFTPSGELKLTVNNPALIGQFRVGQTYYLDFTQVN